MPFEAPELTISERVDELNHRYRNHAAIPVLRDALSDPMVGRTAIVSSFGAESVVLLHVVSTIDPTVPVLFVDTEMLFPETLAYQRDVAEQLGLTDVRLVGASTEAVTKADPFGRLHLANSDACCDLRKVQPLETALSGFDAWITGRKRFQAGIRAALDLFENQDNKRIKINPLAHWRKTDLIDYIDNNNLPRHPLIAQGYPSIGCMPCTSKVKPGEDERAGRWRNQNKVECGIHMVDGKIARIQKEN